MRHDTVLVQWNISSLALGPETYVVRYGTNQSTLNLVSDTVTNFQVELSGLQPNTMYFFLVEATNFLGTTRSAIQTFSIRVGE